MTLQSNLSIAKKGPRFILQASNFGPSDASNVTITDFLPRYIVVTIATFPAVRHCCFSCRCQHSNNYKHDNKSESHKQCRLSFDYGTKSMPQTQTLKKLWQVEKLIELVRLHAGFPATLSICGSKKILDGLFYFTRDKYHVT